MQTPTSAGSFTDEVEQGRRFQFGENWSAFLKVLDDDRISEAEASLHEMLDRRDFDGLSFLDVGCGSGLFSLAATRLGSRRVHSFDYDPDSVGCTQELRRRYGASYSHWTRDRDHPLRGGLRGGLRGHAAALPRNLEDRSLPSGGRQRDRWTRSWRT